MVLWLYFSFYNLFPRRNLVRITITDNKKSNLVHHVYGGFSMFQLEYLLDLVYNQGALKQNALQMVSLPKPECFLDY